MKEVEGIERGEEQERYIMILGIRGCRWWWWSVGLWRTGEHGEIQHIREYEKEERMLQGVVQFEV